MLFTPSRNVIRPVYRELDIIAQIGQFIATHGVTRYPAGLSTMNFEQWNAAVRGDRVVLSDVKRDPTQQRRVIYDHIGREHVQNGLGEWLS